MLESKDWEMYGGEHRVSRNQNQEYIQIQKPFEFSVKLQRLLYVFALYSEDIDKAEVLCVEDLPKVVNFCPKKQLKQELGASTITVCAGCTRTNDQGQYVVPLQLKWGPSIVCFNACRRWT